MALPILDSHMQEAVTGPGLDNTRNCSKWIRALKPYNSLKNTDGKLLDGGLARVFVFSFGAKGNNKNEWDHIQQKLCTRNTPS